jgi:sugar/nucleoside kinase (ribokinase family)
MAGSSPYDLLGLGCVAVDELLYVARYPRENDKAPIEVRAKSCGGTSANALVAAAKLGVKTAWAGTLGEEEDSRFVEAAFTSAGVDGAWIRHAEAARPIRATIVVNSRRSSRTVFYDLAGATPLDESWPPEEAIAEAKVLLIDQFGVEGMLRAARIAQARRLPIIGDFENTGHPGFEELLALTDHLILPQEAAAEATGADSPSAAVNRLWSERREAVVVTCSEKGCWYRGRGMAEGISLHHPAYWVEAADTTGCGDVFRAAYAVALLAGQSLEARLRFASAAAALKATKIGGQASFPSREELEAFLRDK